MYPVFWQPWQSQKDYFTGGFRRGMNGLLLPVSGT